ncbi:MAG: DNA alkylation repair protein [Clostridiaceae bacterium]|nr:DNA alkylation repair protein [Clostridiaceae bacterium]
MNGQFDIEALRKELDTSADEKYRSFHLGLCKTSKLEIKGVRLPQLRKLEKKLIKDGFAEEIKKFEPASYEENMIKALVIAGERKPFADKISDIEAFIPLVDNWAVCDAFCSELKPKQSELGEIYEFVNKHIYAEYEYEIRLSVVLILDYLITDDYIDKVLKMLYKVDCSYYYTSMAVAWALSFCFINFKEKTLVYLKNGELDEKTFLRTKQKIVDSFRVNSDDKKLVRSLGQHNI